MATISYAHVYWDTTCFICFLNKSEKARSEVCEDILQRAKSGDIVIYTSTLTIAETIRPKNAGKGKPLTAEQVAKISDMFKWRWLKKIDLDQRIAFKAAEISRDYGLKPADAIHAASALSLKQIQVLQHWDRDYSKISTLIRAENPQVVSLQPMLIPEMRKTIGPEAE